MRIVAVADTHLFTEDIARLPDGDVLVHAGDMIRAGNLEELREFAAWFLSQDHPVKIIVAGNHDRCLQLQRDEALMILGPDVIYLEDSGCVIEGVRWWGSPWQPEFNDWAFNLPRGEALAEKWRLVPDEVGILVTHAPPAGIGDRSPTGGRNGCEDLLARVEDCQPRLHLFGHIHQDGGLWRVGRTTFVNVTTWECERGATVLDYDPVAGTVVPVVVPPPGY